MASLTILWKTIEGPRMQMHFGAAWVACRPPLVAALASELAPLAMFLSYTAAVLVLAGYANRLLSKTGFVDEYYLGRRGLGVVGFTLTFGATAASAGTFAGFPALIYTHGWSLALWIAGYMVVPACGLALFGKRLNQMARKTGAVTLPDVLRDRFESRAPAAIGIAVLVFLLFFYLVPQFKLGALILQQLLADVSLLHWAGAVSGGWLARLPGLQTADPEYLICLALFSASVIAYTTFGGFRAVVWTDVLQGAVMLLGVMLLLGLALARTGGMTAASEQIAAMTPPRLGTIVFRRQPSAAAGLGGAPQAALRIPADTWVAVESDAGGAPLLVRTNEPAIVPAGSLQSSPTKAVQLTTPEEIARLRAAWRQGTPPPLPDGVTTSDLELRSYVYGAEQPGVYATAPGPSSATELGFLPLGLALSFFVYWPMSGAGQPAGLVRLMAFNSSHTLRRSLAALTIYFSLIYFPLVMIFCCARVILPGLDQTPDRIMPALTFELSQWAGVPWLAGLLIAAPFAAAMSTVDSIMLLIASALVRDIYQRGLRPDAPERRIKRLSYGAMLLIGAAAALGAADPPRFLQYLIVFTGGGLSVAFLAPMGLALYWPRTTSIGMASSMAGGLGVYLAFYLVGYLQTGTSTPYRLWELDPLVWGLVASLVIGVAVSWATPAPSNRLINRYFARKDA